MLIHPTKLFYLFMLFPALLQAAITAKVDRDTVYQGQKFTLTIETTQTGETRPDLRQLQQHFSILGTRKVTVSSHTTNAVTTKTRWVLQLSPVYIGEQIVPSLRVGNEFSPELSLSVLATEPGISPSVASGQPIFLNVEIDKQELYLNAQAIIRAKLYHLEPLPTDASLSAPESPNALIKTLEEQKKYTTNVRGQNYNVTETSYTLFPRQAGEIEVSPVFFTATMTNNVLLEFNSDPIVLNVLPQSFSNSKNIWLPAISVFIEDNLQTRIETFDGTETRRIITMEAEGLPASALPSMSPLQNELADIKLLNVVLEEQMTDRGIVSQRIEELLITPKEAGEITLPAIDIPWLNTTTNQAATATIQPRILVVDKIPLKSQDNALSSETIQNGNQDSSSVTLLVWILTIISIFATLGCIYSFNRVRSLEKNTRQQEEDLQQEQDLRRQAATEMAERNTFQALSMACNQNNPEIAQLRLIEWAQSFWDDVELHTLEQICEYANNQTINFLVLDLEQHLYSSEPELWQGDLLLEAISKIRERRNRPYPLHEYSDENLSISV